MLFVSLALSSLALVGSFPSSSDAQRTAWRAHAALETKDLSSVPWLLSVLAKPPQNNREIVLEHVLDALIQLEAPVDAELLHALVDSDNAELHRRAIVLLSRDVLDGESILAEMIDGLALPRTSYLAAAELLIQSRSKEIAPRLLPHLHPAVEVVVHDSSMGFGRSYGFGCGGIGMIGRSSGFPPPVRYDFVEGEPESAEDSTWRLRLVTRPKAIWVVRRPGVGARYGRAYEPDTEIALDLLAELSGLDRASIDLEDDAQKYISWTSAIRYQVELEAYIRVRLGRYDRLVERLRRERLLDRKAPRLDFDVSVRDLRHDKSPLPIVEVGHIRSKTVAEEAAD